MSAALKLEIYHNGQRLREVEVNGEVWAGRDESCSVRLDDRAISRKHGVFKSVGNVIQFEKKSKFGEAKVQGQDVEVVTLKSGDRIAMGPFELAVVSSGFSSAQEVRETALQDLSSTVVLQEPVVENQEVKSQESNDFESQPFDQEFVGSDGLESHDSLSEEYKQAEHEDMPQSSLNSDSIPADTFNQEPAEGEDVLDEAPEASGFEGEGKTRIFESTRQMSAFLIFGSSDGQSQKYELVDSEVVLGRSPNCHVVLDDKRSSRKNTSIRIRDGKYWIRDLGSSNGTQVNGVSVDSEVELQSGDRVRIGDTEFTLQLFQPDYEQRAQEFISVPTAEVQQAQAAVSASVFQPAPETLMAQFGTSSAASMEGAVPPPGVSLGEEEKKSFIGKFLDRYRAMNTKQQIIYGALILVGIWFLFEEEPDVNAPKAKMNIGQQQGKKKEEKKPGNSLPSFESLSPEQQRYVEAQYQLGFDLYKAREYDKSMFEIDKIFKLVHDYKQAREIYSYAAEGKRQLEAREEERKRKEEDRQRRLKLQALVEQASALMDQGKYAQAETLFPEIELLEPENTFVHNWRNQIMAEQERKEREREEQQKREAFSKKTWGAFNAALQLKDSQQYYEAIEALEAVFDMGPTDKKLVKRIQDEIRACYRAISEARDPLLAQAKDLEKSGSLIEAYRIYEEALKVDPETEVPLEGMKRIRETLANRAKSVYTEGVFAESFNDFDTAEKKYREVLNMVPKDDDYYAKAQGRIKKITVFKRDVNVEAEAPMSFDREPASIKEMKNETQNAPKKN